MATTVLTIDHIVKSDGIVGGVPRIAGTRIPVYTIVMMHQEGMDVPTIAGGYPHVTEAQVYAALSYYADHHEEIDGQIAAVKEAQG